MSVQFLKSNNSQGFVIDRPGYVMAIPILANGQLDWQNAKRNVAVINTISVTNTRTKTNIPNGNGFYPAGDRVTDLSGTLAIEFSTYDPTFWAMASGTGELQEKTGDTMLKLFEPMTIDQTAGTVVLPYERATIGGQKGTIIVTGTDGTPFTEVEESAATAGQFKVTSEADSGETTITFNTADKGKSVVISEQVKMNTAFYTIGKKPMQAHQFIIDTTMSNVDNTQQIGANIIISRASIGSDTTDALQKDPSATKTLTFDIYAPRAGEDPYKMLLENAAE